MMRRSLQLEILECRRLTEPQVARVYHDLTRIHRWLGDTASIVSAVRRDPLPVRRILDIGCGRGGVLHDLRQSLAVDVVGVDVEPVDPGQVPFSIIRADAVTDRLPRADIAFSMCLSHHLSERQLIKLIRNVGRSSRRFIMLDLVRHPIPLALFSLFVAPLVSSITAADGRTSVRRSYTPVELAKIANAAIVGSGAHFHHSIAPLYIRQILDISYRH